MATDALAAAPTAEADTPTTTATDGAAMVTEPAASSEQLSPMPTVSDGLAIHHQFELGDNEQVRCSLSAQLQLLQLLLLLLVLLQLLLLLLVLLLVLLLLLLLLLVLVLLLLLLLLLVLVLLLVLLLLLLLHLHLRLCLRTDPLLPPHLMQWYSGTVTNAGKAVDWHLVKFSDGAKNQVLLSEENYGVTWLSGDAALPAPKLTAKAQKQAEQAAVKADKAAAKSTAAAAKKNAKKLAAKKGAAKKKPAAKKGAAKSTGVKKVQR